MRAVLDTNVFISSVISTGVPHEIVVKGFSSEYQIVVSVATLTEFRDTLLKYPEKFQMDEEDVQEEVETIRYFAEFVDPDEEITAVDDDPDDDKFLEAAVAGNVDYIVSGDRHLLDLDSFQGIDIVEPRAFYERLTAQ
ncbi:MULTISPECIES: putative toxin-antitoxin system toxin component, PIN family [Halobacteriales]|uniref:Nucleotide binding protein PINc n=3 Tax=Halobacteriales TaxID=2235 RepID=L0JQB8_NATP1|nr:MULTISPECIES: putative toxin-antitoxin system toxin component, PIN family [Halobacteria]AGB33720.1 putative toxin-antitoxin system toxin component, PIN family [Natrinema pellirubrum DSM 15624]ELY76545.1 nucleotide binding protein PINc [Natrinema pellirubrum DSM 15624]SDY45360.1 putative toxin-antitoxin system toxin component, PIN family [Halobellus clavatus]